MCEESEKSVLYNDLIEMIVEISDYMLAKSKMLKERIGDTMAGRVLKLFSEKVAEYEENVAEYEEKVAELEKKKAEFEGEKTKLQDKETELNRKEKELSRLDKYHEVKTYVKLLNEKILDLPKALEMLGLEEEEFLAVVDGIGLKIEKVDK